MSRFIGRPLLVCNEHVQPRICGCMGVQVSDLSALEAATPEGRNHCAICGGDENLRTVRACMNGRCFYLYIAPVE